jgi:MFS family permease
METIRNMWNKNDIPIGVRVLTLATSIRWFGWGFAETLIPVFIFSFAHSYAQTGLLKSAYDVAFIIALPIVGIFADRVRGTSIILLGLSFYFIVGTSYFLAGISGMVIFIVIARFFNGIGYAMDSVGRETYFRRHTPKEKLATVFGYFDTIGDFWWIVAALLGIILIKFFSIGTLLFMMVPFTIVGMFVIWRFRKNEPKEIFTEEQQTSSYKALLRETAQWSWKLKLIIVLNFFLSIVSATVMFFLPIQVFTEGAGYTPVIIMGVIMTIPAVMGWALGGLFDKKGMRVFGYGLLLFAILLILLALMNGYVWQIIIGFLIGVIIELLWIGSEELVTLYTKPEHFGRVDGLWRSIDDVGAMIGPILAGFIIDIFGSQVMYLILALLVLTLTGMFVLATRFMKVHHIK